MRSKFNKGVEHFLNPEVVDSAPKEDGCLAGLEIFFMFKRIGRTFKRFNILT